MTWGLRAVWGSQREGSRHDLESIRAAANTPTRSAFRTGAP